MTTTPTASPELLDLDKLEALARAATPGRWMRLFGERTVYDRMEDGCRGNAIVRADLGYGFQDISNLDFIAGANPAAVLALIALARRAQPEGEAPQAEACYGVYRQHPEENDGKEFFFCSMWHNETNWGDGHRVVKGRFVPDSDAPAATLSPLCGAQHAESGKEAGLTIGEAFKAVGGWMNGGELGYPSFGSMNALLVYTQKMLRAALAAQQVAAPGALDADEMTRLRRLMRAIGWDHERDESDKIVRGTLFAVLGRAADKLESAPGTPEAPKEWRKALHAAVSAIYFDDSSDYRWTLGAVVRHLDADLAAELISNPKAAYDRSAAQLDGGQEGSGS